MLDRKIVGILTFVEEISLLDGMRTWGNTTRHDLSNQVAPRFLEEEAISNRVIQALNEIERGGIPKLALIEAIKSALNTTIKRTSVQLKWVELMKP